MRAAPAKVAREFAADILNKYSAGHQAWSATKVYFVSARHRAQRVWSIGFMRNRIKKAFKGLRNITHFSGVSPDGTQDRVHLPIRSEKARGGKVARRTGQRRSMCTLLRPGEVVY